MLQEKEKKRGQRRKGGSERVEGGKKERERERERSYA